MIYCEHEHRVTASATAASDLIISRTMLGWWGPRVQTLCWTSFDKLSRCSGTGLCCLQPEVIWQLRNGCCWAAALQLPFPCLTSCEPPPFSVSLNGNKDGLRSCFWQFLLRERDLHCENSAKCLLLWMDWIIPDWQEIGILETKRIGRIACVCPHFKSNCQLFWSHQWS